MNLPIRGANDPRFAAVRDAFAANFTANGDDGLDRGAAFAVVARGRLVVDLWVSYAFADPDAGLGVAYVMNRMLGFGDDPDPRRVRLLDALYGAL